ncbi:hypothetical protein OIU77_003691 [Salix suchowensis]|uniref:Uncharacterized protein n=1 Tax=Salix suchowensis TaxID=1278906 RepID=A0ABQ8ZG05_9ROSI|nr:hypothetical protein OIU77_003691 [Salix suchowensis]KAJ6304793.1 hypothetical protein OIU78_020369 [Salix suchowensis]
MYNIKAGTQLSKGATSCNPAKQNPTQTSPKLEQRQRPQEKQDNLQKDGGNPIWLQPPRLRGGPRRPGGAHPQRFRAQNAGAHWQTASLLEERPAALSKAQACPNPLDCAAQALGCSIPIEWPPG